MTSSALKLSRHTLELLYIMTDYSLELPHGCRFLLSRISLRLVEPSRVLDKYILWYVPHIQKVLVLYKIYDIALLPMPRQEDMRCG